MAETGVLLGVDVGEVRVGVARTDPRRTLAVPVETVPRDRRRGSDVARIAALVAEHEAVEVVVGLPRSLSGAEGAAAARARDLGEALRRALGVPVRYADERLTTVSATRALREAGVPGRRQRAVVDQVAAVAILESVLAAEQAARREEGPPAPT